MQEKIVISEEEKRKLNMSGKNSKDAIEEKALGNSGNKESGKADQKADLKNDLNKNAKDNLKEEAKEAALSVGYFKYKSSDDADMARKEQDKIMKLEKQINYDNPRQVYALYLKILSGDFFHTYEGLLYIIHLQDYLYSKEKYIPGPIPPIPSDYLRDKSKKTVEELEQERVTLLGKVRDLESDKSKAFRNIRIRRKKTDNIIYKMVIAALVILVIVMLIISAASNSPNIINYRNQIQNEYSDWEQKLNEKERELRQKEKELEKYSAQDEYEDLDEVDELEEESN